MVDEGEEARKRVVRSGDVMPDHIRRGFFFIQQRGKVLGGLAKRFKRYWFCIDEECCQIRYYTRAMKVRGTVDLRLVSDVQVQPREDRFFPFVLNSERTGRSTVLASLTQEECTKNAEFIRQIIRQMPPVNEALYRQFVEADTDGSLSLEFPEVKALFAQRNVQITVATMRQKFDEVDLDGDESLDFSEFERLDELFRQDTYAMELFRRYSTCSRFMDVHVFRRFLREHQREHRIARDDLLRIIAAHRPGESGAPSRVMDVWGFTDWLTSVKENSAVSAHRAATVSASPRRPLAAYFVYASRQTYLLTGDPLGPVGVAGYTAALRRGMRFVEIDTKADINGVPVVAHPQGTSKVALRDVLAEIARLAFAPELGHAAAMPLIVALNSYLAPDEQAAAAAMLEHAFGDRLATIPRRAAALPTLESLMGKVILMMKLTTPDEIARSSSTMSSFDEHSSVISFLDRSRSRASKKQKKKKKEKDDKKAGKKAGKNKKDQQQAASAAAAAAAVGDSEGEGDGTAATATGAGTGASPSSSPERARPTPSSLAVCVTRIESDDDDDDDGSGGSGSEGEEGARGRGRDDSSGFVLNTEQLAGLGARATVEASTPVAQEEVSGESSEEERPLARRARIEFATRSITCERLEKLVQLRVRRFAGVRRPAGLAPFVKDADGYLASTPTSLSTARLAQMCAKGVEGALRTFARDRIVKVYPTSARPADVPGWACGAQLCPVHAGATTAMSLAADALFQDNGCCGFLEKPAWMLREPALPPADNAVRLTVKIVSARQLPRIDSEVVDPFVAMFVKGWKDDQARFTTRVVVNNGWDPRWDESHDFVLHAPELDVLLFTVWDKDNTSQNDFIANAAVAVRSLKLGVRALPLFDENRAPLLGSRLLIETAMEPLVSRPVPKAVAAARRAAAASPSSSRRRQQRLSDPDDDSDSDSDSS